MLSPSSKLGYHQIRLSVEPYCIQFDTVIVRVEQVASSPMADHFLNSPRLSFDVLLVPCVIRNGLRRWLGSRVD